MEVVLMTRDELVENAIEVDRDTTKVILDSVASWYQEKALALFLQAALGRAVEN
jgi:hypothetical protein